MNRMSCQPFGFMGSDVEVCSEISYCPHIESINGVQNPYYERLSPINGVRKDPKNYTKGSRRRAGSLRVVFWEESVLK